MCRSMEISILYIYYYSTMYVIFFFKIVEKIDIIDTLIYKVLKTNKLSDVDFVSVFLICVGFTKQTSSL